MADAVVGMRTGQDLEAGVHGPRLLHDLPGLEGLRNGDEEPPGRGKVGQREHLRVGGVADDHLRPVAARSGKRFIALLEDEDGAAGRGQPRADKGADATIPKAARRGALRLDQRNGGRGADRAGIPWQPAAVDASGAGHRREHPRWSAAGKHYAAEVD